MKKLLATLLVATMLVAMFVMPSAAADNVNFEAEFDYAKKAPTIDGVVKKNEYGALPVHSYPENKDQFVDNEHNQYAESDWDFDFYAVWDENNLYMAWVLNTETHIGIPEQDYNGDGNWDVNDSGYIWMYSCVQFIFTPGAPKKGETAYQEASLNGDYLEVGLALSAEGEQVRAVWCKPHAAADLEVNDWNAAIKRDESAKTTTYEVAIPWAKSGLASYGNGAQFGLTYAVAAQEYNVKPGMIEWQNGVLTSKDADSAAVITLVGNEDIPEEQISVAPSKEEGKVPDEAKDKTQLVVDGVNLAITGEKAYLFTDPAALSSMNTKWATNVLLAPVEGENGVYSVAEVIVGAGEDVAFTTEITDGMLVYAAHSDGEGIGAERKNAATALTVGTTLKLFGIDLDKKETAYTNSMLYVVAEGTVEGETSGEESVESTVESTPESTVESTPETTESTPESTESTATSAAESSEAEKADEEGGSALIWIIIGVVVVAAGAAAAIILKKKKA